MRSKRCAGTRHKPVSGLVVLVVVALCAAGLPANAAELTLAEVVSRALAVAPRVALASANSDIASAQVGEALAPLLPSVSAGSEYYQAPGYNQIITNGGLSSLQLVASYTAYDFGQRLNRWRAARYWQQASTLGVRAARQQIIFDATLAYYDLLRRRAQEKEIVASLRRLEGYLLIIEALRRSGRAIPNDVLRIRGQRDRAELALVHAQQESQRASVVLGSLIGLYGQTELNVASVATLPPAPKGKLARNPEYQAAERRLKAAQANVRAAKAERYPTLTVALTAGYLGVNPPSTFQRYYGASYDGLVTVPIFEGGLIRSRIDEARARRQAVSAEIKEIERVLARRVADARLRYERARQQLAVIERAEPTAYDAFALDWTRFLGGGRVTLLEVLTDYQEVERLRLERFDVQFGVRQAAAEGELLLGLNG